MSSERQQPQPVSHTKLVRRLALVAVGMFVWALPGCGRDVRDGHPAPGAQGDRAAELLAARGARVMAVARSASELAALGPMTRPERRVAAVVAMAAAAWLTSPWLKSVPGLGSLSDMGIAMLAGLALFLVPSGTAGGGALLRDIDRLLM